MPTPSNRPLLYALASALAVFGPLLLLHQYVHHVQQKALDEHTAFVVPELGERLEEALVTRLALVESIAFELEGGSLTPGRAFTQRALGIQARFDGFTAINWTAPDGVIRQVVPEDVNAAAQGRNVYDHPIASRTFALARQTGQPQLTGLLELFQGGRGFASYFPIAGGSEGFVNGVFRINPLLDQIFDAHTLPEWAIALALDGEPLLERGTAAARSSTASFEVLDHDWQLTMAPSPALYAHYQPLSTRALPWVAVLLSGLTGLLVYLAQLRRQQEHRLRTELEQARRLEALGTLAGGIAHDFNNVLTVLGGTLELMQLHPPTQERLALDIQLMRATVQRAHSLTGQLLSFSRKEAGSAQVFQAGPDLATTSTLLRRLMPHDIRLVTRLEADDAWLTGDPGLLQQAIVNLAINARDAMPDGGVLTVASRSDTGELRLSVVDTGTGMDPAIQKRVFEPFFTTKGPGKGTGLGLAMVARTVEQMGGRVELHSTPGDGTQVVLHLPLTPAPVVGQDEQWRTGHILVVDDDPVVREVLVRALQEVAHEVTEASSAEEALQLGDCDLLVTDLVLPGADGEELATRLRQRNRRAGLPVVFVTGYAEHRVTLDTRMALIPKPVPIDRLRREVSELLSRESEPAHA